MRVCGRGHKGAVGTGKACADDDEACMGEPKEADAACGAAGAVEAAMWSRHVRTPSSMLAELLPPLASVEML